MDRRGAAWPIRGLQDRSPRTGLAPGRVHVAWAHPQNVEILEFHWSWLPPVTGEAWLTVDQIRSWHCTKPSDWMRPITWHGADGIRGNNMEIEALPPVLAKPGLPSIKYDRSIERSHRTGCDQSQRVFKNGSAHFLDRKSVV